MRRRTICGPATTSAPLTPLIRLLWSWWRASWHSFLFARLQARFAVFLRIVARLLPTFDFVVARLFLPIITIPMCTWIYRFLIFGGIFATHGVNSAFFIKLTAIHSDSQATPPSAITLLLLRSRERKREDVTMTTRASARQSSLGMRCAHCNNALIAPEWTEERNERQIHVWRCWKCDFYFETIHTKVMEDSTASDDIPPSRFVA
jgi:hypothetical protein